VPSLPRHAQTGMGIPSCAALIPDVVEISVFTKEARSARMQMETTSHAVKAVNAAATLVQLREANVANAVPSLSGIQSQRGRTAAAGGPISSRECAP